MAKIMLLLLVASVSSVVVTGCNKEGDPWDSTKYFENHRTQPAGQAKRLRDRLFHTQGEKERPAHQID
jgi:hypothetical protein